MTEMLNCPSLGFSILREENGSLSWKGTYKGAMIKGALPVDEDCIILLDPDASKKSAFRNLLRVGRDCELKWVADLPTSPDAFVDMRFDGSVLVARSWSGYKVRLDPSSGRKLAQEFVK
jgi:hypothetical protein